MILEDGQAGLPSAVGSFKNQWHRETDGIYTTVYAGSDKFQHSQGLVVVNVSGVNTPPTTQLYHTPLQLGPVRVTGATGELLTLQAENGTLFYFDVPTRQWLSPPPLPTPSLTLTGPELDAAKMAIDEAERQTRIAAATVL